MWRTLRIRAWSLSLRVAVCQCPSILCRVSLVTLEQPAWNEHSSGTMNELQQIDGQRSQYAREAVS